MTQTETHIAGRSGSIAVTLAVAGLLASACGSDDATTDTTAEPTDAAATSEVVAGEGGGEGAYTDGEYSATGEYVSPGGPQEVGVTVTLSNSVITALSVDTSEARGTSAEYQGEFAGGIDELVVGKSIDELDVSKVAGSSLTSTGFNDAIEQIKSEAAG